MTTSLLDQILSMKKTDNFSFSFDRIDSHNENIS